MTVGEPLKDHSHLSRNLQRTVEDGWRRPRLGLRVQKRLPKVEPHGSPPNP